MLLMRMPTLPTATMSELIVDSDSESEDDPFPLTPPTPTAQLPYMLPQTRKTSLFIPLTQRPIAGSRRVFRYRETQGIHISGRKEEILQSITASPGLGHKSFEELRMECYLQTQLATGAPPKAVDPRSSPWAVIPPAFNAFRVKEPPYTPPSDEPADVVMLD